MTPKPSPQSHDTQDEVFGKYGCAVLIIASVLFAVQRFILFSWLLYQASLGRAFAPSAAEFLFGNPPYTLTDILLGLEFPDEGLLYLLQPHNLAIAVTQAAHFGLTIGLVYIPFFLFGKARTSPRYRAWFRAAGCLFALAMPVSVALLTWTCWASPFLGPTVASRTPAASSTIATAPTSAPERMETIPPLSTASSTPAPPPRATPSGIVVWMEADGSGDYATLEEAVQNAPEAAAVVLGPGTYRLDDPLNVERSLRLYGAGMDNTQIVSEAEGYVVRFIGDGPFAAEGIEFRHQGGAEADSVVVEGGEVAFADCSFAGAVSVSGDEPRGGLRLQGDTVGAIHDCVATANEVGVVVTEQAGPTLERNVCAQNDLVGIVYRGSAGGVARENQCSHQLWGILVSQHAQPLLDANVCTNNLNYGITYHDNAAGVAQRNECSANGDFGIELQDQAQPTLEGNTCANNEGSGILYVDSAAGVARLNKCSANGSHGIEVKDDARPTLEGNVCSGNGEAGLFYGGNASGVARGNECSDNGLHGIGLQDQAHPTLEENVCARNKECGIMYFDTTGGVARRNECSGNRWGIYVAETADPSLMDNNCHDNTSRDIWDKRS